MLQKFQKRNALLLASCSSAFAFVYLFIENIVRVVLYIRINPDRKKMTRNRFFEAFDFAISESFLDCAVGNTVFPRYKNTLFPLDCRDCECSVDLDLPDSMLFYCTQCPIWKIFFNDRKNFFEFGDLGFKNRRAPSARHRAASSFAN